jgi:hypothetical protein
MGEEEGEGGRKSKGRAEETEGQREGHWETWKWGRCRHPSRAGFLN